MLNIKNKSKIFFAFIKKLLLTYYLNNLNN